MSFHLPFVLKGQKGEFQNFNNEFLLKANMLDISGHFVGQRARVVPVGDPLKQRAVLLWEGFLSEEIRGAYQAWSFIDGALQSEADRSILKRCKSFPYDSRVGEIESQPRFIFSVQFQQLLKN